MQSKALESAARRLQPAFDFHIHSSCSDGCRSPSELRQLACEAGLTGISITDHDTLDAYGQCKQRVDDDETAASVDALRILPGVEFSTRVDDEELHILGYFPAGISTPLHDYVESILEARNERIREGLSQLRRRGVSISLRECRELAAGRVISRTHIARLLVQKRYVSTEKQAYRHLLSNAHFPKPHPKAGDVIQKISALGGISIWAHPFTSQIDRHLDRMVDDGIDGIEIATPWRRPSDAALLRDQAARRSLLTTAGSDWHTLRGNCELGDFRASAAEVGEFLERIGWEAS